MLSVVAFKWAKPGYRSQFGPEHVNTMYNMIRRNYADPFQFVCVTDDPAGIDERVRCIELWDEFSNIPNPHGDTNPSCFRRLKLWSEWARTSIGPRIVQVDLDMVITGDMRPVWNRPEPCVLWADNLNPTSPYNGAMQLITPGLHPVYECFKVDPASAIKRARSLGFFGSDQAQLALWLGPYLPRWTAADDGCISWRVHCRQTPRGEAHRKWAAGCRSDLPSGAKIVNFHGIDDPGELVGRVPWITENYR